jgi:flagellar basal-body rod protein FlgC
VSLFSTLEISGAALGAERQRAEVVTANMANSETTRTPEGGPYRRKEVIFGSTGNSFRMMLAGAQNSSRLLPAASVQVTDVVEDPSAPILRYEPNHPDANKDGYVAYPNINPVQEMVDLMGAVRAYQLNSSAVNASKQMIQQSLEILR